MKSFVFLVMLGLAAVAPMGCDGDQSAPNAPKTRNIWGIVQAAPADPSYDPVSDPPFMPVPADDGRVALA